MSTALHKKSTSEQPSTTCHMGLHLPATQHSNRWMCLPKTQHCKLGFHVSTPDV